MSPKAYNPDGIEPELRGKLQTPPEEEMAKYYKKMEAVFGNEAMIPVTDYKGVLEHLKRGEARALGHYAYEMMYDVYPGMEDDLMNGAWETHGHIFPDYVPRSIDIIDFAIQASQAKMNGILCKDHFFTSLGQAWAAQWVVDEMVRKGELEHGCKVLGTYILAWSHHPDQVNLIRKYPNLGCVFFSTMTAWPQAGDALPLLDQKGKLLPEIKECIDLCASYRIPIHTGHRKPREVHAIVAYGAEVGAHILITHGWAMSGTREDSKEMGRLGAFIELNAMHGMNSLYGPCDDCNYMPEYILDVGADHIVVNTDMGQPLVYNPVEGLRIFIRMLLHYGIKKEDIKKMVHTNPEKWLYLQE
jgi:hypothetical protein